MKAFKRLIANQSARRHTPDGTPIGPSNSHKTVMLSLAEGWTLQFVDNHGWCLFQPNRARPFARIGTDTVEEMTTKGWLSAGIASRQQSFRPGKYLSPLGEKLARRLVDINWAEQTDWDPYQYQLDGLHRIEPGDSALGIKAA